MSATRTIAIANRASVLAHRQAISSLEEELDPRAFARIDRSAIVNLARVRELRRRHDGRWVARLADGTELPVSRRRREQLLQRLGPGRAAPAQGR